MSSVSRSITAWRHSLEAALSLGPVLTDPEWTAPTECPRWTVKDVYAHLAGVERWLADGHPEFDEDITSWAERAVLDRRDRPPALVLEELRQVYELRRYQLARDPVDPDRTVRLPTGHPGTMDRMLRQRVLDVWTHEQDIRRAVGRAGNLASPGAAIVGDMVVTALPTVVAHRAQALPGSVVGLTTRGEVDVDVAVSVDRHGRGTLTAPDRSATTQLAMTWEAYTRLSCGRGARGDYDIRITGDRGLAERVLTHLSLTP